jgi:hypothetical protein
VNDLRGRRDIAVAGFDSWSMWATVSAFRSVSTSPDHSHFEAMATFGFAMYDDGGSPIYIVSGDASDIPREGVEYAGEVKRVASPGEIWRPT